MCLLADSAFRPVGVDAVCLLADNAFQPVGVDAVARGGLTSIGPPSHPFAVVIQLSIAAVTNCDPVFPRL